jgi:hypothetical protein
LCGIAFNCDTTRYGIITFPDACLSVLCSSETLNCSVFRYGN